ncbi:MAG: carbonic anhydrase [Gammaproteobacteria bacterium]|nr:carbonic anhydrase [Gammaproteobacteria bacterium]
MKKLIEGIIDFRKNSLDKYRNKFSKLASQHSPDALFVACCDSRVVPNVFASSDPGDLFVLRNIGNLIPPYDHNPQGNHQIDPSVSAAIEFSLLNLEVKDIVVCGHSECGAMHTILENKSNHACCQLPELNKWLEYANSSYQRFKNNPLTDSLLSPCDLLSQVNVLQQLDNLKTYPQVAQRLQTNQLTIHGWWFDLATANVFHYDQSQEKFVLIDH